jgi:superfamily II DNA or RNA helicase
MSYFSDNYTNLRYPLGDPGLREAQAGAIHAIAAHFTISTDPALVVMPTGSGKTAVLLAAPFALRATRALIITPSRLVREQTAEGAGDLGVLKRAGVLADQLQLPKVFEIESKCSAADWEKLRDYDFVVATPNCTSPEIDGIAKPPIDLFDVILFDEAHHAAAATWSGLLDHFAKSRRILFTATPYRRDKQLIRARSIYTYPLRKAFEDKIFGKVNFVPVQPANGAAFDVVIAQKTEEIFRQDRAAGLAHVVMVRTDSKTRAEELKKIYEQSTGLRLQLIHSGHSAAFVKRTIEHLREGTVLDGTAPATALDGIVCVNMMGEGFDFPFLKIAAIHAPHQSLAVTLQFIGRFARTSARNIGEASFVAVPEEIGGEAEELFHEGAVWSEIVPNLSEARVAHEQHVREVIETFKKVKAHREEESDLEFELGTIKPFCHVKVFKVDDFAGFDSIPRVPKNFNIIQYDINEDHHCSILLLKEQIRPRWTDYEELSKVEYDFVLTFHNEASGHLFICSSRRASLALYDSVGEHYSNGTHALLSLHEVNRVLHDLKQAKLFQVGMKNSVTSNYAESYQTKMGSNLRNAVSDTDGRLFHRGHVYLKGEDQGKSVTIGYSSGSKIWSNSTLRVAEIIAWCKTVGTKLIRTDPVITNTGLDHLGVGESLTSLPEDVIAVEWNDDVYKYSVEANGPNVSNFQLHDIGLAVLIRAAGSLKIQLSFSSAPLDLELKVEQGRIVCTENPSFDQYTITRKDETCPFKTYVKEHPFNIYLSDFSRISHGALFRSNANTDGDFSAECLVPENWTSNNIDITKEFAPPGATGVDNSIHGFLTRKLPATQVRVVIYDHGTGEIGDFLTMNENSSMVEFSVYHCKGSEESTPGQRVGDIYEVAGQVVKSLVWLRTPEALKRKIRERLQKGSTFLKGDWNALRLLFEAASTKPLEFSIYFVQPGLSAANLAEKLTKPMAAARDFVARSCNGKVRFMISP